MLFFITPGAALIFGIVMIGLSLGRIRLDVRYCHHWYDHAFMVATTGVCHTDHPCLTGRPGLCGGCRLWLQPEQNFLIFTPETFAIPSHPYRERHARQ